MTRTVDTLPQHWAGEATSYRPSGDAGQTYAIVYDATPGGRKNDDGTTSYSMRFPALIVSEYASDPKRIAASVALELNAFPAMLGALLMAERFISGFEDDEIQEGVDGLLASIRAAIAKAEGRS